MANLGHVEAMHILDDYALGTGYGIINLLVVGEC